MTDDDLRLLFASTTLRGRRPPADAELHVESDEISTRIFASWNGAYGYEQEARSVCHLRAIRDEGEPAAREPNDVKKEIRRSVIDLANCCIESTSPAPRRAGRPFVAR